MVLLQVFNRTLMSIESFTDRAFHPQGFKGGPKSCRISDAYLL